MDSAVQGLDNMQVNHNSKVQELEEKIKIARQKSEALFQISNDWENRIKSSQAGFEAFEVANVYETIATTLETAHKKSQNILKNYEEANERLKKYMTDFEALKVRSDAYQSKLNELENEQEKSEKALKELTKRHNQLEQSLNLLNKDAEKIENWVNRTQQNEILYNDLEKSLKSQEAELKQSNAKASELLNTIKTIESLKNKENDDGSLETLNSAKQMNKTIDELNMLNLNITDRVAKIASKYRNLDDKVDEVNEIINNLKLLIESTRNIANEIKVAVKFKNSSYIKLRNAPVFMPSMTTSYSLYLNTTNENAPISILYNRNDPNAYMALYLKNGAAQLQYRLSDQASTNTISTEEKINNHKWYKLEVERVGRFAKLKVLNDNNDVVTMGSSESDDSNVVFNIDSMNANFYLGQFRFAGDTPAGLSKLTNDLAFKNQYEGAIDTVTVNRHSFGLWNYEDAQDIDGEIKRQKADIETSLVNSKLPVHFNEYSFLCTNKSLSSAQKRMKRFDITLKFKTTNPNGILWFGRDDKEKINVLIHLVDGHVVVDLFSIRENNKHVILDKRNKDEYKDHKVNDNKAHVIQVIVSFEVSKSVSITIIEKENLNNVNGDDVLGKLTRPLDSRAFAPAHVWVGGVPESYKEPNELPKSSFIGCFEYYFSKNILENERVYLQQELLKVTTTTSGVDTKCPDVIDQCSFQYSSKPIYASFSEGINSIEDVASLGISFVPRFINGTLLFIRQLEMQDGDAINYIHLYLENLHVNLIVKNTKYILRMESKKKVNYNDLNHVYVVKNEKEFTLNTNDVLEKKELPEKVRIYTNSDLYVGGVPLDKRTGISDKFNNFQGCVVDVIYKNKPLKFQHNKERSSVFIK